MIRMLFVAADGFKLPLVVQCALVVCVCLLVLPVQASAQESITVIYDADSANFPNPERGWFHTIAPDFHNDVMGEPLTPAQLAGYRSENLSLVRRYYLIKDFIDSPISQSYLDNYLINDLNACRQAGLKLIPRFTYIYNRDIHNEDAPIDRVLQHIEQLRPIFQQHWDALFFVEAGFVGAWGEWHGTTNNLVNDLVNGHKERSLNENSKEIIDKLLDVLPAHRGIVLRNPDFKIDDLFSEPLTSLNAFTRSKQARIGYHNDGWLATDTDWGTWNSERISGEKAYVRQDTLYVPQSGEPASSSDYAKGRDPIADIVEFHWTAINRNQWDARFLYDHWKSTGTYDSIERLLGYRFVLRKANLHSSVKQGGDLTLTLEIRNQGAARLYNPRLFEVILRHHPSGTIYRVGHDESDVRLWLPGPGETKTLTVHKTLPQDLELGAYDVLLNLPDPAPNLYGDPRYSIRLANVGLWEDETGFNSLNASVRINSLSPPTNLKIIEIH